MTEVEEWIFGGDCKGGCMHNPNRVVKMKKHLPFWGEYSIICNKDRIVVDHAATSKQKRLLKTQPFDGQCVGPIRYYDLHMAGQ